MSTRRYMIASAAACSLGAALFACATNVELGQQTYAPPPEPNEASVLPEADVPDATAADAPEDAPPFDGSVVGSCSTGGFCYYPLPVQTPLNALSGASADDLWAMGSSSLVHWNGTEWENAFEYEGPLVGFTFLALWATQPNSVWAIGRNNQLRSALFRRAARDGGTPAFYEVPLADNMSSVSMWGPSSSDNVWIAFGNRVVLRYTDDGSGAVTIDRFTPSAGPEDRTNYLWKTVWGFGPDDVYFGGNIAGLPQWPVIAHFDGSEWTITRLPTQQAEVRVLRGTVSGQRALWAAETPILGGASLVYRYSPDDSGLGAPGGTQSIAAMTGVRAWLISPSDVWVTDNRVVRHWDGTKLDPVSTALGGHPTGAARDLWAADNGDVWIVGEAVAQGPGFPAVGFAARRTKDGGAQP